MILVEHLPRVVQVEVVLGGDGPRQRDQPLEVGPHDGVLGRLGRDHAQAVELALGGLLRLGRQVALVELAAQLVELGGARVALAELALDRLQLLAEVELLLVLVQLRLHLRLDLVARARAARSRGARMVERRSRRARTSSVASEVLLLLERDVQVRRDQVGHLARVLDVHHDDLQLVGQVGDHRDELGELVHHRDLHRLEVLGRLDARPAAGGRGRAR